MKVFGSGLADIHRQIVSYESKIGFCFLNRSLSSHLGVVDEKAFPFRGFTKQRNLSKYVESVHPWGELLASRKSREWKTR